MIIYRQLIFSIFQEEYLKMKAERKVQKKLAQGAEVKDGEVRSHAVFVLKFGVFLGGF